ncbi:MAG: U32 family peptidase, partial [Firmicutes bacterium]|nr:U32 family peptidase [Bacillota bacterium]
QVFEFGKEDSASLPVKELAKEFREGFLAEIPAIVYPADEEKLRDDLLSLKKKGLEGVVCENISALALAKELNLKAYGGLFLNITNSEAVREYVRLGLDAFTFSMELPLSEIRESLKKAPIDAAIAVYGYMPLMKFRNCPRKAANGDSCKGCSGLSSLTDRLGNDFPLICRDKKYSELLNCVPLYTAEKVLPNGLTELLYFTFESRTEASEIQKLAKAKKSSVFKKTGGLYHRELL